MEQGGSNWKQELSLTHVRAFMLGQDCDANVQLATCNFIEKALEIFSQTDPLLVKDLIKDLKKLVDHPMLELRKKVYSILKSMCLDSRLSYSEAFELLMNGLADTDVTIVSDIRIFLETHWLKKFSHETQERVQFLLEKVLTETSQDAFINVLCDLTLAHTENSPTLKKDLFDQPLANLMEFQKMEINTDWRSQFGQDLAAPMFAETLASTQSSSLTHASGKGSFFFGNRLGMPYLKHMYLFIVLSLKI